MREAIETPLADIAITNLPKSELTEKMMSSLLSGLFEITSVALPLFDIVADKYNVVDCNIINYSKRICIVINHWAEDGKLFGFTQNGYISIEDNKIPTSLGESTWNQKSHVSFDDFFEMQGNPQALMNEMMAGTKITPQQLLFGIKEMRQKLETLQDKQKNDVSDFLRQVEESVFTK